MWIIVLMIITQTSSFSQRYKEIKEVGQNYMSFMHTAGQSQEPISLDQISQLFAQNCEKIENGTSLFKESKELINQLKNAREAVGKWAIKTLFMTASPDDNSCTIQFIWDAEKIGQHTTMVALFLDEQGKISKIHEVFNKYQKQLGQ